jgi:hypothetical protein
MAAAFSELHRAVVSVPRRWDSSVMVRVLLESTSAGDVAITCIGTPGGMLYIPRAVHVPTRAIPTLRNPGGCWLRAYPHLPIRCCRTQAQATCIHQYAAPWSPGCKHEPCLTRDRNSSTSSAGSWMRPLRPHGRDEHVHAPVDGMPALQSMHREARRRYMQVTCICKCCCVCLDCV